MNMKTKVSLAALLLLALPIQADDLQSVMKDIKPGLWEVQQKAAVDGQELPDMNKMLEKVPPEMRALLEAKMSKKAAAMASGKPVQVCITAEQIARQEFTNTSRNRCKMGNVKRDGNVSHMTMQCSKPKGEGETTVTRHNSESWSSVTHMNIEEYGSVHAVNSQATAKWLSSDCGDVKPIEMKAPKTVEPEQSADTKAAAEAKLSAQQKSAVTEHQPQP